MFAYKFYVEIKLNKQFWISLVFSQNLLGIRLLIFRRSTHQIEFLYRPWAKGAINKYNRNQFDAKQTFSRQRKWLISFRLNNIIY